MSEFNEFCRQIKYDIIMHIIIKQIHVNNRSRRPSLRRFKEDRFYSFVFMIPGQNDIHSIYFDHNDYLKGKDKLYKSISAQLTQIFSK